MNKKEFVETINVVLGICLVAVILFYFVKPIIIEHDALGWITSSDFLNLILFSVFIGVAFLLVNGEAELKTDVPKKLQLPVCCHCGKELVPGTGTTYVICDTCEEKRLNG